MGKRFFSIGYITRVAALGAIAAILFFLEIPIIGFYKLDFSTVPALIGGFALGPVAGFIIVLIKDLVGLTHSSSFFVGELADLIMSGSFVLTASLIYRYNRTRKGALISMLWAILVMTIVGAATNYYLLIPFYINVMNFPEQAIIETIAKVIPMVNSIGGVIVMATIPFNLLKGIVLCGISFLLYKHLSPLLKEMKA